VREVERVDGAHTSTPDSLTIRGSRRANVTDVLRFRFVRPGVSLRAHRLEPRDCQHSNKQSDNPQSDKRADCSRTQRRCDKIALGRTAYCDRR
jgi:hypothetical protein